MSLPVASTSHAERSAIPSPPRQAWRRASTEPAVKRLRLFEGDGRRVDLEAEQGVGFHAQVLAVVELHLAVDLVGGEIEIAVRPHRHRVRPKNPRIVGDGPPLTVRLPLADAVVLVVAGVDAPK